MNETYIACAEAFEQWAEAELLVIHHDDPFAPLYAPHHRTWLAWKTAWEFREAALKALNAELLELLTQSLAVITYGDNDSTNTRLAAYEHKVIALLAVAGEHHS